MAASRFVRWWSGTKPLRVLPPFQLEQAISRTVREEWGRLLAVLVASIGDLQLAEDVLQDAVEAALHDWRLNGLPASPAGWLIQTARRRAIDRFRRDARFRKLAPEFEYLQELERSDDDIALPETIPDKRLELVFTCCHPALDMKSSVALTLRTLGGLSTDEIARAFLDRPKTMAQRLVRARQKIALAGIPYEVPSGERLNERLNAVLAVIYFIFNEGYSASSGDHATRRELSDEAIRLARITYGLLPDQPEAGGLLALMLLHDSRRSARQCRDGSMVALEEQDRSQWNRQRIVEGTMLLSTMLQRQRVGSYQLQAAISALHAEAVTWGATDWSQISALYALMYALQPSPVVRINQAVALSYADGPERAIELLDELFDDSRVNTYQPYFAARADVLSRSGNEADASVCYDRAIALAGNASERRFLTARRDCHRR